MTPTIDALLSQRASTHGDAVFLRMPSGDLTFAEVDARVNRVAVGLQALGVGPGEHVAMLLPNGPDIVVAWFAAARLGAIAAPINTAFRGAVLAHVLQLAMPRVVIVHADLLDVLASVVELGVILPTVVVSGADDRGDEVGGHGHVPFGALASHGRPVATIGPRLPEDPAIVLFTSGTTGRSKGCVLSHRYVVRQAELMIEHLRLRHDDVLFCPFPLFHLDAAVLTVIPALVLGTTAAIVERFSVSAFWQQIRQTRATVFDFMGATLTMLHKQASAGDDEDNPARLGWGVPLPEFTPEFERRFGVELVELYGSTDVGVPIYSPLGAGRRLGSCGVAIDAYEVRIVGDDGAEEEPGVVGEIAVRPREASLIMDRYLGMPEETAAAMRDGWFHTGDLASRDADGYVWFAGRRKDAIRRRGENISAFEVEEVVDLHPGVLEAAAFGVPSELGEQDVMVAVVARPGMHVDPAELVEFCRARMARYMVPRYVDIVAALPRTPTEKVEKHVLADRGITPTTWDRERA